MTPEQSVARALTEVLAARRPDLVWCSVEPGERHTVSSLREIARALAATEPER